MPNNRRYTTAPLATIAMVTYNSAPFVREAIESVLAQDCDDFELLVCDDGSTDDTWDVVKSFTDRRVRASRGEANVGEYRNRNRALSLARGKYLMYIDGDDLAYPHCLSILARNMERFPDAAMASGLGPCDQFVYPVELTPRQFCSCAFFGPNVLANDFTQLFFRTEALRAMGGFDLRYRSGDTHIQFALGMRRNVLLVGGGLAWWRKRRGQASEPLRESGQAIAEMWRYSRELLDDPACPLTSGEKAIARANMSRLVLRRAARLALHGRLRDAARLAMGTGVPIEEFRCLLAPYNKRYLLDVGGDAPIRGRIGATPQAQPPAYRPLGQREEPRARLPRRSTAELRSTVPAAE